MSQDLLVYLQRECAALGAKQEARWIYEDLQKLLAKEALLKAQEIIQRRKGGEPLAYILGWWEFRHLKLSVGQGVLIPRPETEELVDLVLKFIEKSSKEILKIVDLGAGSGAIGLSVFLEAQKLSSKKNIEVTLVEKSHEALVFLRENVKNVAPSCRVVDKDWITLKNESFDVIVSNPPYITQEEYVALEQGVRDFEPKAALVARDKAHGAYSEILDLCMNGLLAKDGAIFFEHGPAQPPAWDKVIPSSFKWEQHVDMSGKKRFLALYPM